MWVVFAGNRPDDDAATVQRFPAAHEDSVIERLRRLLDELRPDGVIGAAAAGTDLLLLEAALGLGIAAYVVLPAPPHQFREASVADRGR